MQISSRFEYHMIIPNTRSLYLSNFDSSEICELKDKIVYSKKLSVDVQKKIQTELSSNFKSQLKIDYKYDPNLIAGLIIQVGSVMVDTSIKTKLKKLEKNMLEA